MNSDKIPSGRMIRAARGLLNFDQIKLGELVGVSRRTIIRVEGEEQPPINPRRVQVCEAIRDTLERDFDIRFIYEDKTTGEGVAMRKRK